MGEQLELFQTKYEDKRAKNELESYRKYRSTKGKKQIDHAVFEILDCLRSPVITWRSAWQAVIPDHVMENITIAGWLR